MMDGLIDHVAMGWVGVGGPYDTHRGKLTGKNVETRPFYPTSRPPQGGRAAPGGWKR